MECVVYLFCFILITQTIWVNYEKKRMQKMIKNVTEQLDDIKKGQGNRYAQIKTTNQDVNSLINSINSFLEMQYEHETEYKKRNQLAMQMMTNISHDIKTPITVLGGYTEILQNKVIEGIERKNLNELIVKMKEKTDRSIRSINQLFDMAKIESGDYKVELQEQDVVSVCKEIILEYYDMLEELDYEVHIDLPNEPLIMLIDRRASVRILKNLIDNALKYGNDGKYLGIGIVSKDDSDLIGIFVEDHGKGIQIEQCEDIFRRSYRIEKNDKYSRGSGLGLSISKNLAVMMGGDIVVESIPEEKTIFFWNLKSEKKTRI